MVQKSSASPEPTHLVVVGALACRAEALGCSSERIGIYIITAKLWQAEMRYIQRRNGQPSAHVARMSRTSRLRMTGRPGISGHIRRCGGGLGVAARV